MLKHTPLFFLLFMTACCPFEHDDDDSICEFADMYNTKHLVEKEKN